MKLSHLRGAAQAASWGKRTSASATRSRRRAATPSAASTSRSSGRPTRCSREFEFGGQVTCTSSFCRRRGVDLFGHRRPDAVRARTRPTSRLTWPQHENGGDAGHDHDHGTSRCRCSGVRAVIGAEGGAERLGIGAGGDEVVPVHGREGEVGSHSPRQLRLRGLRRAGADQLADRPRDLHPTRHVPVDGRPRRAARDRTRPTPATYC